MTEKQFLNELADKLDKMEELHNEVKELVKDYIVEKFG